MCYARRQRSSWARIKLSNEWYLKSLRTLNLSFELWFALFTFCWVVFSFRIFEFRYAHTICLYFPLCCSIFNDRFAPHSWASLTIISLLKTFVNRFFEKSFKFFELFSWPLDRFQTALPLYYFFRGVSRTFCFFFAFCFFFQNHPLFSSALL